MGMVRCCPPMLLLCLLPAASCLLVLLLLLMPAAATARCCYCSSCLLPPPAACCLLPAALPRLPPPSESCCCCLLLLLPCQTLLPGTKAQHRPCGHSLSRLAPARPENSKPFSEKGSDSGLAVCALHSGPTRATQRCKSILKKVRSLNIRKYSNFMFI